MPNWWGGWLFLGLVVGFFIFVSYAIYDGVNRNKDCEAKGGVVTRAGCLKPEVFIK